MCSCTVAVRRLLAALCRRIDPAPSSSLPDPATAAVNPGLGDVDKGAGGAAPRSPGRKRRVSPGSGRTAAETVGVPIITPSPLPELVFNAQAISNALYGLQNMGCNHPEVLDVLRVLTGYIQYSSLQHRVRRTPLSLTPQHVGNALYGLQNMSSATAEVQLLLRTLVPLLVTSEEENVLPSNIDNALYGLKRMSAGDCPEVRSVLSLLNVKLQSCTQPWRPDNIARAVYGLQNMSRYGM